MRATSPFVSVRHGLGLSLFTRDDPIVHRCANSPKTDRVTIGTPTPEVVSRVARIDWALARRTFDVGILRDRR